MRIMLTTSERTFLLSQMRLPQNFQDSVQEATPSGEKWSLEISEDDADAIRDLLTEKLAEIGFDENYSPTKAGVILEDLIDKFFIG